MTRQAFFEYWNGKYCEIAGPTATNQCVDLANQYIKDVLNLPIIEWTNAVDFPSKANGLYDFISNSPTNIPQEGDLVIWGGQYGHIAIFIQGDVNSFKSFDQNYPTGSPCHVQGHTYANVLGWMHPKQGSSDEELDKCRIARDSHWNDLDEIKSTLGISGEYNKTTILTRIDGLVKAERENGQKDQQLLEARQQIVSLEKKLDEKTKEAEEARTEASVMTQKASDFEITVSRLLGDYKTLQEELLEVKKQLSKPLPTGIKKWLSKLLGL